REVIERPSWLRRTETSACASVPSVTACTWYSSSLASCGTSALMALNTASTGPLPSTSSIFMTPSTSSFMVARCGPRVPAMTVSDISLMRSWDAAISPSTIASISFVDVLLAVGERLHPRKGILQLVLAELVAHLLQLVHEGMAARMLAEHQRGLLQAHHLGLHD